LAVTQYTDCKSLTANIDSLNVHVAEKRLILDLTSLKELKASGTIQDFEWCPTEVQLADGLTKVMQSEALRRAVMSGKFVTMTVETKRANKGLRPTPAQEFLAQLVYLLHGG
jgi:hypothetical protein